MSKELIKEIETDEITKKLQEIYKGDGKNEIKILDMVEILQNIKQELESLEWYFRRFGFCTLKIVLRYCNNIGICKFLEWDNILNYSMINNTDTKFIAYDEYPNVPCDFRIWIAKNIEILKEHMEKYER